MTEIRARLADAAQDLASNGWCVLPGVMSADEAGAALARLWKAADAYSAAGGQTFMNVLDPNYKKTAKKSVAFQENDESNYQTACIRKSEKIESLVDNLLNLYKDYHSKCESIDGEIS